MRDPPARHAAPRWSPPIGPRRSSERLRAGGPWTYCRRAWRTAPSRRSSATTGVAERARRPATRSSRCRSSRAQAGRRPISTARRPGPSKAQSCARGAGAPAARFAPGWRWTRQASTRTFYCASVTRCDPGRSPSGRGDRLPTATEQELCAAWREHELRLLRPRLIVTVGGLAARRLLGIRRLTDAIGESFELDGATAIPLPHPSGASSWLNDPANRARLQAGIALVLAALATPRARGTRREERRRRSS